MSARAVRGEWPVRRRWEVTEEELARIARARKGSAGAASVAKVVLRSPRRLGPEVLRGVSSALVRALSADNAFVSVLNAERARRAVPDAAAGVGWYDEGDFLAVLLAQATSATRALELGCGGGRISRHVASRVAELVCTDVSPAMVREARENLSEYANVRVAGTDGFTLGEHADAAFDLVLAQGVLGYLEPNPLLALLAEVRRVLKPGGTCVFNFFTLDHPDDARAHLATVLAAARRRRFSGGLDRAYTLAQLQSMYAVAGLQLVAPADGEAAGSRRGRTTLVAHAPQPAARPAATMRR